MKSMLVVCAMVLMTGCAGSNPWAANYSGVEGKNDGPVKIWPVSRKAIETPAGYVEIGVSSFRSEPMPVAKAGQLLERHAESIGADVVIWEARSDGTMNKVVYVTDPAATAAATALAYQPLYYGGHGAHCHCRICGSHYGSDGGFADSFSRGYAIGALRAQKIPIAVQVDAIRYEARYYTRIDNP